MQVSCVDQLLDDNLIVLAVVKMQIYVRKTINSKRLADPHNAKLTDSRVWMDGKIDLTDMEICSVVLRM